MLVYLDSKDFIQLTDRRDDPKIREAWDFLCRAVDEEHIQIGYSYLHIIEVLNPDSRGFEEEQRRYGETISRLCTGVFPFTADLIAGDRYAQKGIWGPKELFNRSKRLFELNYVQKEARKLLGEKTNYSRQQRILLSKPKNLATLIEESDWSPPQDFASLGLDRSDFALLARNPAQGRKKVYEKIIRIISDPRHYCKVFAEFNPGQNPVRKIVEEQYSATFESLEELWERAQELKQKDTEIELLAAKFQAIGEGGKSIAKTLRKSRRDARRRMDYAITNDKRLAHERFEFLNTYVQRMVEIEKAPSRSEVRDILHLLYAYETDFVSVDRAMFEKVKKAPGLQGKAFPSLFQLIDAINVRLRTTD